MTFPVFGCLPAFSVPSTPEMHGGKSGKICALRVVLERAEESRNRHLKKADNRVAYAISCPIMSFFGGRPGSVVYGGKIGFEW